MGGQDGQGLACCHHPFHPVHPCKSIRINIVGMDRSPNGDDLRWLLRLERFDKALARLQEACELDEYSELELAGLVQTFNFTFLLCVNVLRDLLLYEGVQTAAPRRTIQEAFAAEIISEADATTLIEALLERNRQAHRYDEPAANVAIDAVKTDYLPGFESVQAVFHERRRQCTTTD